MIKRLDLGLDKKHLKFDNNIKNHHKLKKSKLKFLIKKCIKSSFIFISSPIVVLEKKKFDLKFHEYQNENLGLFKKIKLEQKI
jgi:hypothetical protein